MAAAFVMQHARGINPMQSGLGPVILLNIGITFLEPLPVEAQIAPVHAAIVEDFDRDGHTDLAIVSSVTWAARARPFPRASSPMRCSSRRRSRFSSS